MEHGVIDLRNSLVNVASEFSVLRIELAVTLEKDLILLARSFFFPRMNWPRFALACKVGKWTLILGVSCCRI